MMTHVGEKSQSASLLQIRSDIAVIVMAVEVQLTRTVPNRLWKASFASYFPLSDNSKAFQFF